MSTIKKRKNRIHQYYGIHSLWIHWTIDCYITTTVNNYYLFVYILKVNKTILSEKMNYKILYLAQNSNCFIFDNSFTSM